jgi:hypothetical protein
MTDSIYPLIQKEIDRLYQAADEEARLLRILAEWVERFNLQALLDRSIQFHVFEDSYYDGEKTVPADRYWATIRLDMSEKDVARPILLAAFDHLEKSFQVSNLGWNKPILVENWRTEFDPIHNGLSQYPRAVNRIDTEFIRPAVAGERISPTCTVERVTPEPKSEIYLTVSCHKKN